MGSKAAWRCRACGLSLGQVSAGTLYPTAEVERVQRDGAVVVRCPCGETKVWLHGRGAIVVR